MTRANIPQEPSVSDMIDWQIVRAARTPGPGAYKVQDDVADRIKGGRFGTAISKTGVEHLIYQKKDIPGPGAYTLPDMSSLLPGGRMGKGNPKTDVDWAIYRASQTPGPGQYLLPSSVLEARGGVISQARGKTDADWQCLRTSKQPAPHDYNVNGSWGYLDTSMTRGGIMLGRNSGPARMPAPFQKFSSDSCDNYRGEPSKDHESAKCPWKDEATWSKVARPKSGGTSNSSAMLGPDVSGPDISGPDSPDHASAQATPNEPMKEYEEQGRAAEEVYQSSKADRQKSISAPWRNPEEWSKVAKRRPATAAAAVAAPTRNVAAAVSTLRRPASAGFAKNKAEPRKQRSRDHTTVTTPWRDESAWRSVAKDPRIKEQVPSSAPPSDRTSIETPWRVEGWSSNVQRPRKKKPAAAALAPLGHTAVAAVEKPRDAAPKDTPAERRRDEKLRAIAKLREELTAIKLSMAATARCAC